MRRVSGTSFGSDVRMPGTSFQSVTIGALKARPSSVAVRSEPPRPSVATPPSGARPMKPGTTGTVRALSSGCSTFRALATDSGMSGLAPPKWPSVTTMSTASTYCARRPARAMAAASSIAESRSPRATSRSRVRGERWPRMPTAVQMSAYSPIDASISASAARRAVPRGSSASAAR